MGILNAMTDNTQPTIALSASGNIAISFAGPLGGFHTVEIPMNANGMRLINQILKARDKSQTRLGELGNPTQFIIDVWLNSKREQDQQELEEKQQREHEELLEMF